MSTTPLIPRDIFFGNPEIAAGQLSPDGSKVSFMKAHNGIMNLWVKDFNQDFDNAVPLTISKSPILGYFWSRDGKYVIYVNDKAGDENINIFLVDPHLATAESTPESKNLTPLDEVTAQFYLVSKKDPDLVMIGLNDRDKAWHDLYSLRLSTGELKLLFENNNRYTGYYFDWDETLRAASRTDEDGNNQLYAIDADGSFREIYNYSISESAGVVGWTPDNSAVYLVTNKGDINLSTLYTLDIASGEMTLIESDPKEKVDFGNLWLHKEERHIISTSYTHDKTVRYFKDKQFETIFNHLQSKFERKEIGFISFTTDYQKLLLAVSSDDAATEVYFYDVKAYDLIIQYTPKPNLKEVEQHLCPMTSIQYPSRDGLMISAYMTKPKQHTAESPAIFLIHGGPKGPRDYWGYNGTVQFLANRGYTVVQPNFRASGGFGKEFLNAGDKQWGQLMQDDITYGVRYLIDKGIVPSDKVGIMGGSYGGYATLAGLAFTPEVYACGIDIVGPSNLFTLLDSIPPYWEAGRKWLYQMVGDPDTEDGQALLYKTSPLFSADQIDKPLLIVQGANDPRVKQAESDQIVIALRDKQHPVSYLCAEDEGHGFRKPLNKMAMYAEVEHFLHQHLGGRYQEEIEEDVQATLDKITVDINTVEIADTSDIPWLDKFVPHQFDWSSRIHQYNITLQAMGQEFHMKMDLNINGDNEHKTITTHTSSQMGESSDKVTFDPQFIPQHRTAKQADTSISIGYNSTEVKAAASGNSVKLNADQVIHTDGISNILYIAAIGMRVDQSYRIKTFELATFKLKEQIINRLANTGDQEVYEIVSADDKKDISTYYVNATTRVIEKGIRAMPSMEYGEMKLEIIK